MLLISRLLHPGIILAHALGILKAEGIVTLWFKIWGQIGYRRLGLYICDLNEPSIPIPSTTQPLDFCCLSSSDIDEYCAARIHVNRQDIQDRWAAGQICFSARINGNLAYTCWIAFNSAWIEYLSRWIQLRSDEVYFYESYTQTEWRGGYVATHCQARVQEMLRQKGVRRIIAVVLNENPVGVRAIVRSGYRSVGTLRTMWLCAWRYSWGIIPDQPGSEMQPYL